jgi:hexulose-6-phosphate isomerase
MKKGISWFSIPPELSDQEKFALVKRAGFDGVELPTVAYEGELRELKEQADKAGLQTPSLIETIHWRAPLSSPSVGERTATRRRFEASLEHAAKIGADTVLCIPGVMRPDRSYRDVYKTALGEIRLLAKTAERVRVTLALENVWNRFLLSPLEFAGFLDEVNSPFVKAYFDCGNSCLYGYPQDWIRTLGRDRIAKVHVKGFLDHPHPIGFPKSLASDVPWMSIMEALSEVGYDDYLTVEIKAEGPQAAERLFQYSEELSQIIAGTYRQLP